MPSWGGQTDGKTDRQGHPSRPSGLKNKCSPREPKGLDLLCLQKGEMNEKSKCL